MILDNDYQDDLVDLYCSGQMEEGLKLNCLLDKYLVFKRGQMNLTLGVDNAGKTFWKLWYYTCLAKLYGLKIIIYCSENKVWSLKAKIMGFFMVKHPKKCDKADRMFAKQFIDSQFSFIDTRKRYELRQLIKLFEDNPCDVGFIDPYNSVHIPAGVNSHDYQYEMADEIRMFVEKTNCTIDINMHPVTEGNRLKHKDGQFKGQQAPPMKSHAEGGTKWPSRCDDFTILHRYWSDDHMKTVTLLFVEKVRETETGGNRTLFDQPLEFHFKEYGFWIDGVNPLTDKFHIPERKFEVIEPDGGMSKNFEDHEKKIEPEQIADPEDADLPF